jgi:hypothetical protein
MIAYLDHKNRPLAGVDPHLLDRKAYELIMSWQTTFNIYATNVTENGVVFADIAAASKESVFAWLDGIHAIAVDIQPQDLQTLAGRDPITLAAGDLMLSDQNVAREATRLEPSQIMDFVAELLHLALGTSQRAFDEREERIQSFTVGNDTSLSENIRGQLAAEDEQYLQRLRNAGIEVPELVSIDPPQVNDIDDRYDAEFGIGQQRNVSVDPFAF